MKRTTTILKRPKKPRRILWMTDHQARNKSFISPLTLIHDSQQSSEHAKSNDNENENDDMQQQKHHDQSLHTAFTLFGKAMHSTNHGSIQHHQFWEDFCLDDNIPHPLWLSRLQMTLLLLLPLLLVVLVVVVMMMTHLLSAQWLTHRCFDITSCTRDNMS